MNSNYSLDPENHQDSDLVKNVYCKRINMDYITRMKTFVVIMILSSYFLLDLIESFKNVSKKSCKDEP